MKSFPTLYQKTATGAIQRWEISVHAAPTPAEGPLAAQHFIQTVWGQVDGAQQTTNDFIREGKNAGKANATTAEQQAEKEAKARWTKQKKKGYVEDRAKAEAGEVDDDVILGGIEPMLSPNKSHPKDPDLLKRIKFPCFYQPKLDGIRSTGKVKDGAGSLWSRTRKPVCSVPHIVTELERRFPSGDIVPDGELYSHAYRKQFEDLVGILTQDKPDAAGEYLKGEYHLYDLPYATNVHGVSIHPRVTFETRIQALFEVMFCRAAIWKPGAVPGTQVLEHPADAPGPLYFVKTTKVFNLEQLLACFELDLADEYEGGMAKNADGVYTEGKRNPDVQKMKLFEDHEFRVIAVNDGRGKDVGTAATFSIALPCLCCNKGTPGGEDSRARIRKPYSKRREYFGKASEIIGKTLTVTIKRWTAYGKPYIPTAKAFRDYE